MYDDVLDFCEAYYCYVLSLGIGVPRAAGIDFTARILTLKQSLTAAYLRP